MTPAWAMRHRGPMRSTPSARVATVHDLPGLYRVCRLTGAAGADASELHRDPDLLGHVWVGAYAVAPDAVALVVQDEGGIAGYCVGVPDTGAFESWLDRQWLPPLRQRYPRDGTTSADVALVERIHAWPTTDARLLQTHPAHLHIDLLPRLQGQGWGRRLITELAMALHAAGAGGLHLGVAPDNARALGAYEQWGFTVLSRGPDVVLLGIGLTPTGLAQADPS